MCPPSSADLDVPPPIAVRRLPGDGLSRQFDTRRNALVRCPVAATDVLGSAITRSDAAAERRCDCRANDPLWSFQIAGAARACPWGAVSRRAEQRHPCGALIGRKGELVSY